MFMNRFVRSIEGAIANRRTLFNVMLNTLEDLFLALDRNQDGKITANELKETLNRLDVMTNSTDCSEFIRLIDVDKNGCIDISELQLVIKHTKNRRNRSVHKPMQLPDEVEPEPPNIIIRFIEGKFSETYLLIFIITQKKNNNNNNLFPFIFY